MKIDNKQAEYRYYSGVDTSFAGKPVRVIDVPAYNSDDIGYTYGKDAVYVNYDHPIMNGLSDDHKMLFRFGVNAHELLHILFTDFVAFREHKELHPESERPFFLEIFNIMEDPAIEFWGNQEFGGDILEALRFTIIHIYKNARRIESYKDGFSQFVTACIHFGDMGALKGVFTDEKAKKIFMDAAPIINLCIEEPDAKKRVEYAEDVFDLSRPLWQDKADLEELKRQLAQIMKDHGRGRKEEQGGQAIIKPSPQSNGGKSSDEYNSVSARRNALIQRIEDAKKKKEQSQNSDSEHSTTPSSKGQTSDSKQDKQGNSYILSNEKSDSEKNFFLSDEKGNELDKSDISDNTDSASEHSENDKKDLYPDLNNWEDEEPESKGSMPDIEISDNIEMGELPDIEINQEEYEIPEYIIEETKKRIVEEIKFMEKVQEKNIDDDTPALAPILCSPLWQGKIVCDNKIIKLSDNANVSERAYTLFMERMGSVIRILYNQLNRIFIQDADEIVYRSSGKVDMKRMCSGMATAKLFYKRKDPSNKHDMVIAILFDCSGSMSNEKIDAVKQMLVVMSEVFGKLGIPIYIMGYSEGNGGKVEHRHFIRWNNSARERLKLMGINTSGCNFDGYSIRYMTEVLKKKDATHKLLITLSDGAPNSVHYKDDTANPVNDTRNAVTEAKKFASVLGVAIGDSHLDAIKLIYGKDFLHITNVNDITTSLAKAIKKIVSKWE